MGVWERLPLGVPWKTGLLLLPGNEESSGRICVARRFPYHHVAQPWGQGQGCMASGMPEWAVGI